MVDPMSIDIDKLTEKELIELNHRIVERLKFLESMHAHQEMMQFKLGEQVSFEHPRHGRQVGALIKYNKKTVSIVTEAGQQWNVSPHLVSKIKNVKSKSSHANKVVTLPGKKG